MSRAPHMFEAFKRHGRYYTNIVWRNAISPLAKFKRTMLSTSEKLKQQITHSRSFRIVRWIMRLRVMRRIGRFVKLFYQSHPVISVLIIVLIFLIVYDVFKFWDEISAMWTWASNLSEETWLLSATAVISIIVLFAWMIYAPILLIVLSLIILFILIISLIIVMFGGDLSQQICDLLGVSRKKKAVEYIALGMGGVIAAIVAAAFTRRANAEERSNKLIEKGHDDVRFQGIVGDLGNKAVTVRITAFNRFFYLAEKEQESREKTDKFRRDVFEILCSHLCTISSIKFKSSKNPKHHIERQTLFDILFKYKFKSIDKKQNLMPSELSIDLRNVHFDKLDLVEANLSSVNLSGANLSGTDLSGADLSGADLSNADLSDVNLSGAKISGATLLNADLSNANLSGAKISKARLVDANLSGADLSGAELQRVNLSGAKLLRADLSGARLQRVNLSGAKLWRANFLAANLSGAKLSRAKLSVADLSRANLTNADLSDANFSKANLSGTNLSGAYLTNANFNHSTLINANLSQTRVIEAHINNTHPSSVNFEHANLIHSEFIGARLPRANFRHATFMEPIYKKGDKGQYEQTDKGANFEGARLQNANMRDVNLSETNFKSAKLQQAQFNKYSNLLLLSSIDKADFSGATVDDQPITKNHLPSGKGKAKLYNTAFTWRRLWDRLWGN